MGRKKKYQTEEQLRDANNKKYMRYYWKNAEKIKQKANLKYKQKKDENLNNR